MNAGRAKGTACVRIEGAGGSYLAATLVTVFFSYT